MGIAIAPNQAFASACLEYYQSLSVAQIHLTLGNFVNLFFFFKIIFIHERERGGEKI